MAERDRRTIFLLFASFSYLDLALQFPLQILVTLSGLESYALRVEYSLKHSIHGYVILQNKGQALASQIFSG